MTLPSLGRVPGSTSSTSPRSLQTSRMESATAAASDGSPSNGVPEFFNGAFGAAANIVQGGNTGQIDGAAVTAAGGTIAATNTSGQVTIAYWAEGTFAPGSGALYIMADVDMWATTPLWPSASYTPLNDNGTVALNVMSRLPEPDVALLLLPGLVGLALAGSPRRRVPRWRG